MPSFAVSATIRAPASAVWATLADIGTIADWNPGVVESRLTTGQRGGMGAGRYCALPGQAFLEERVVEWEPDRVITFRIVDSNLPFKTADIRFTLDESARATTVTVTPHYRLQWGPLGSLLDLLFVRRTYRKGMLALLAGLKLRAEGVGPGA